MRRLSVVSFGVVLAVCVGASLGSRVATAQAVSAMSPADATAGEQTDKQADRGETLPEPSEAAATRMRGLAERAIAQEAPAATPRTSRPASSGYAEASIERRPLGPGTLFSSSEDAASESAARPTGGWILNTLAALGVVIGLALFIRWAYAKLGGKVVTTGGANPAVEVLSRTSVAPRSHVVLLRVGHRVLVLSDSPQGLRTLADLDNADEVASVMQAVASTKDGSLTQSFGQLMGRFNGEYDAREAAGYEGLDDGEHQVDRARDSLSGLLSRVRVMGSTQRGGGQ